MIDLRNILTSAVSVSAPCRLDISGTWDLKAYALLYEHLPPMTTNIALSLRTHVKLKPFDSDWVRIGDYSGSEEHKVDEIHFDGQFGLLFAVVSHFNVHGLEIELSYEAPPKSGLGGSGVLAVTTIKAINEACKSTGIPELKKNKIVELAHNIEDGLRYSYTGMQDQCAAAFGGINKWIWTYSADRKFKQEPLPVDYDELGKRLVVAYIGKSHDSSDVNSKQVEGFLNGQTRAPWFKILKIADEFATALVESDWAKAGKLISEETKIRCELVPSRITPLGERLQKVAHEYGAGFATAGAGNGGCVWALCQAPEDKDKVESVWKDMLDEIETACILDTTIDREGLMVE